MEGMPASGDFWERVYFMVCKSVLLLFLWFMVCIVHAGVMPEIKKFIDD